MNGVGKNPETDYMYSHLIYDKSDMTSQGVGGLKYFPVSVSGLVFPHGKRMNFDFYLTPYIQNHFQTLCRSVCERLCNTSRRKQKKHIFVTLKQATVCYRNH
jgi:hypothetical protein